MPPSKGQIALTPVNCSDFSQRTLHVLKNCNTPLLLSHYIYTIHVFPARISAVQEQRFLFALSTDGSAEPTTVPSTEQSLRIFLLNK